MSDVVLVVDMLIGFLEEGRPLDCGPTARAIIPRMQEILRQELAKGSKIIYLKDTHDPDDQEFAMFPEHCVRGSEESQIIPELAEFPGEIIPKRRYSGFFDTNLAQRLREMRPDKVVVMGVCTNICVLYTVADLRNRDYPVLVHKDAVASFDQRAHEFALKQMKEVLGATIV